MERVQGNAPVSLGGMEQQFELTSKIKGKEKEKELSQA